METEMAFGEVKDSPLSKVVFAGDKASGLDTRLGPRTAVLLTHHAT